MTVNHDPNGHAAQAKGHHSSGTLLLVIRHTFGYEKSLTGQTCVQLNNRALPLVQVVTYLPGLPPPTTRLSQMGRGPDATEPRP
jgi:hypothetical protein